MVDGNIEQIIKEILVQQLNIAIDRITLESRLMEDLGLDSFGSVELAFALEEKFELKISTFECFATVAYIAKMLNKLLQ